MTTTLSSAAASLAEVQSRIASASDAAHAYYELIASTHRELGRLRGKLALFMADPSADASDNAKGFAQNVAHAIDGLERVLQEASAASLSLVAARRHFAAQVESWQSAVTASPTP